MLKRFAKRVKKQKKAPRSKKLALSLRSDHTHAQETTIKTQSG
jgi:hypothetical protein